MKAYDHYCTIQTGDLAGNINVEPVTMFDLEVSTICDNCGEPLATIEQIVAHIYGELTS